MDERSIGLICLRDIIFDSKNSTSCIHDQSIVFTDDCSESLLNESQYGSSQGSGNGSGAPGSSPGSGSQQQVPSMSVQSLLNFGRG